MKNVLKTLVFTFALLFMLVPVVHAEENLLENAVEVGTEEELVAALAEGKNIVLTQDIAVTKPLHAKSDLTIYGAGFTLSADPTFTTDTADRNGSLLTVHKDAIVSLIDIVITNNADASKYGLQAYLGGFVLQDVTIENCKWGAILVNGGGIAINSLTLNNNPWGIEFGMGDGVEEVPGIVMNGEIIVGDNQEKVLWLAENDNLTGIEYANLEGTKMVLSSDGATLALTAEDGSQIISNELADKDLTFEEVDMGEEEPTEPTTLVEPSEENPDTGDISIMFIATLAVLGTLGTLFTTRKVLRRN